VAGFQTLVDTVRATGATNVIFIGGLAYSNDLTPWLTYKPTDPKNNIAAFAHIYNFNTCANTASTPARIQLQHLREHLMLRQPAGPGRRAGAADVHRDR
jgi:hypothetical protein